MSALRRAYTFAKESDISLWYHLSIQAVREVITTKCYY